MARGEGAFENGLRVNLGVVERGLTRDPPQGVIGGRGIEKLRVHA